MSKVIGKQKESQHRIINNKLFEKNQNKIKKYKRFLDLLKFCKSKSIN